MNEFTNYCNHYYQLNELYTRQLGHLKNLSDDAPLYGGEKHLHQIDAIIAYYRDAQAVKAEADETLEEIKKTGRTILMIMQHFSIPPRTALHGEIPGELAYDVWANENGTVFIEKTADLAPEPDNPNIIVIKFSEGCFGDGKKVGKMGKEGKKHESNE